AERGRGVPRSGDLPDPRILPEEIGQLLQCGTVIVDGEDVEHEGDFAAITVRPQSIPGSEYPAPPPWRHSGNARGRYLGTRRLTLVPAPGAVSTVSPYSSP